MQVRMPKLSSIQRSSIMGIINDYEEVLIGNQKKIPAGYFMFDKKGNERVAIAVIRYAIEELLGWGVQDAIQLFNPNYIDLMKLNQVVNYIVFPSDVTKDDTEYILYLLYPKHVDYDVQRYTIRVYEKVLANETRYPKDYMYGYLGMLRAKICLQYSINKNLLFKSPDDLYRFFASKDCLKYLKTNKLYQLYTSFYSSPLEYMHDSMPSTIKNNFLYHNYDFMMKYQQLELEDQKKNRRA